MRQPLSQTIEIPEGVEANVTGSLVSIKGPEGENKREFDFGKVEIEKKVNKLILQYEKSTKKEKKTINTTTAHIKNMIKGVQEKFVYELKVASSHFPMTVKIEGKDIIIKNFLGEKKDRKTKSLDGVEIKINKDIIEVISTDKELAGLVASNFEKATRITNRDRRIFQDGIYITNKSGRVM
jgi:large subunit ribosomal protein L6